MKDSAADVADVETDPGRATTAAGTSIRCGAISHKPLSGSVVAEAFAQVNDLVLSGVEPVLQIDDLALSVLAVGTGATLGGS